MQSDTPGSARPDPTLASRAPHLRPRLTRWEPGLTLLVLAALSLTVVFFGPLPTNDGPVHMSFARMLWFGPANPLQSSFYEMKRALDPNLLGYFIAGPLIPLIGSRAAETILQLVCVLGIPLAGWAALASIERSTLAFVPAFAAFSLNQMFFLGLYNFSLSVTAALLAFASIVRAMRQGGWWWLCLAISLVSAFFSHLAGVIMAFAFIGAWFTPASGRGLKTRTIVSALLALAPVMVLLLQYLIRQPSAGMAYGPAPVARAFQVIGLKLLATATDASARAALALALFIIGFALWAALGRARRWRSDPASHLDTARFALLIGGALVLVMIFPDDAGGGWTHVRRMIPLPFFAALLLCATHPWTRPARLVFAAATSALTLILLGCVVHQQIELKPALTEFDALVAEIGPNCSVLPIILWPDRTVAAEPLGLTYSPFYQIASRAEQRGDRVSLFNFLARLNLYPARFRDGHEPQAGLFHWTKSHDELEIKTIDIGGFERAAQAPIDYIITQESKNELPDAVRQAVTSFSPVGPDGQTYFHLYQRTNKIPADPCTPKQ